MHRLFLTFVFLSSSVFAQTVTKAPMKTLDPNSFEGAATLSALLWFNQAKTITPQCLPAQS